MVPLRTNATSPHRDKEQQHAHTICLMQNLPSVCRDQRQQRSHAVLPATHSPHSCCPSVKNHPFAVHLPASTALQNPWRPVKQTRPHTTPSRGLKSQVPSRHRAQGIVLQVGVQNPENGTQCPGQAQHARLSAVLARHAHIAAAENAAAVHRHTYTPSFQPQ